MYPREISLRFALIPNTRQNNYKKKYCNDNFFNQPYYIFKFLIVDKK